MTDTRQRLIDGAIQTIRDHGVAGASARTIAAAAGVNQALVFYHFGSVHELLEQACLVATEARVAPFVAELEEVRGLRQLLDLGRRMHAEERSLGNVTVLAQMLAAAQSDRRLAGPTATALHLWIAPIQRTLDRVLIGSPLAELVDTAGLARAVSAGFIGLELFEGVDPAGADAAMTELERLAVIVEALDDLGPVTRRLLRSRLRPLTTQGN
ncbi:TetR/AcrR family transcriptional regulator [Phytoactinopolyspora limicola]|uniref:TetR/AcrR family transcriptional regulator n=1 Tax=Phytoactinopolyspora limicola TaxID=2715536 RepID=UPI00140AF32B|nr:TetR/AcrR family transcriptional regulator [Phytoactinopolyspora limicola]